MLTIGSFSISGQLISLIGGILALLGSLVALFGSYLSSTEETKFRDNLENKTTAILDSQSDKSIAASKILEMRQQNFSTVRDLVKRNDQSKNVVDNAKSLGEAKKELKTAKEQSLKALQEKYEKILIPVLKLFADEFFEQLEEIEEEGFNFEKKLYQFKPNSDWALNSPGSLIHAKTHDGFTLYMNCSPPKFNQNTTPPSISATSQPHLPGVNNVSIGLERIEINFDGNPQNIFLLNTSSIDAKDKQIELVNAVKKAVRMSISHQLAEIYSKREK